MGHPLRTAPCWFASAPPPGIPCERGTTRDRPYVKVGWWGDHEGSPLRGEVAPPLSFGHFPRERGKPG